MNYIISVLLAEDVAQQIGKRGSENGLVYYNGTYRDNRVVALAPSSIQDKFYAVPESILLSDAVVIGTSSVDKLFAEMLVAASLSGRKVLLTRDGDASAMLNGLGTEIDYSDKFEVAEKVLGVAKRGTWEGCRVDVDKVFPVTGVGTVALGFVTKGKVSVHDKLMLPSGAEVSVKSIQSNDVDVESAGIGTRVGLALKGVKPEDVRKGDILSKAAVIPITSLAASMRYTGIAKEEIEEGSAYGFVSNFSYTNAAVTSSSGAELALRLERQIPIEAGDEFMLIRRRGPRVFAHGTVKSADQ